jgi:chromosome segregation ATPase
VGAVVLLGAGCSGDLRKRVEQLEREKATAEAKAARLAADSKAKDVYLASATSLLNEVQDRMDQIEVEKTDLMLQVEGTGDTKRFVKSKSLPQALDRIDGQLRKNKEQIGKLEALVAIKGQESQGLRVLVNRLKKQNGDFEAQIVVLKRSVGVLSKDVKRLKSEVESLETKVTQKEQEIQQKNLAVAEKEVQLKESEAERWAGFYIIGSKKELEAKGIIDRKGMMKRRLELAGSLVEAQGEFERVDVLKIEEISLGSLREVIELLPARPAGSYRIEKDGGEWGLIIQDRDKFWQLRHLIVVVKK